MPRVRPWPEERRCELQPAGACRSPRGHYGPCLVVGDDGALAWAGGRPAIVADRPGPTR
jgi:hypothetical protein